MKKLIVLCIGFMIAAPLLASCGTDRLRSELAVEALLPARQFGTALRMDKQRDALYQFIVDRLSGSSGVHTNYRDTDQTASVATGHEVLSESAGLMMRYYALTEQQAAFEREWALVKQNFNLESGFSYRYSPLLNKRYQANAAVDDLRIIRALYEAADVFHHAPYKDEANRFGSRFYEHNVKDGYVYDFYDEAYSMTNSFITLCYVDLKTLQLLPESVKRKSDLSANMLRIVQQGYLSDDFPFYETRYHYDTKTYSAEAIRTVESLLTILALAEVRQHNPESIHYLKEQVKAGTLYGSYTKQGVRDTDIQSTAVYAIAAMIGSELGDQSLYEESVERMNELQVWMEDSPFHGGFADMATQQAYSFDNLMALMAYIY